MGPPSQFHPRARRSRALVAILIVTMMLGTVGAAFFRTQVLRNNEYTLRSNDNRLHVVPIPAPRGTILDRNGELVAETLPNYSLLMDPAPEDSVRARLERLSRSLDLGLDSVRMAAVADELRTRPDRPALVRKSLTFEEVARIEEQRTELSWVRIEAQPVRRYPQGEAIAHLIGYVAEISQKELDDSAWTGYRMGQSIGKAGLERQYERRLGGRAGERYVEVDARGRIVGQFLDQEVRPPVPGKQLQLTLDIELQRFAHRIFPKDKRGAIVAMVPSTGEVLALYSYPTYDPNLLVDGVDPKVWSALNSDARRPLLNRASDGRYPPGSTWKLATAIIGLQKGVITPQGRMPIACSGGMSYMGRYSRCWKKTGHGSLDLAGAIQHSCNVYFYQLGIRLGLNQLAREGARLGFARRTGIDLPQEKSGKFPDGSEWYKRQFGWAPTPSEVMSLAIGQGPNDQTPLRMSQFFSALAGDGTAEAPRLVARKGRSEPETDLKLTPKILKELRHGMARVVEPGGTAQMSALKRWKLYGKTGTSQNTQDPKRPHAWFTGFAGPPEGEPEVVVAVVVEFGESGSGAAAPLAAKVADFYLNRKHGLPTDSLQTLGERLQRR